MPRFWGNFKVEVEVKPEELNEPDRRVSGQAGHGNE